MAAEGATRLSRGHRTICLPISEEAYARIIDDPAAFRRALDECFRGMPELFPADLAHGYRLKDDRTSAKQGVLIRRIVTRDGTAYSIRPSFLMPYLTARTDDVEGPLFLRKFGVPFWALAHVFGADPIFWYRLDLLFGPLGVPVRPFGVRPWLSADELLSREALGRLRPHLVETDDDAALRRCRVEPLDDPLFSAKSGSTRSPNQVS
jgi:hypothetical protein